jgi:serine protease Do
MKNKILVITIFFTLFFSGVLPSIAATPPPTQSEEFWTHYADKNKRPNADPNSTLPLAQNVFRNLAQQLVPTVVNIYTTIKPKMRRQQNPFGGGEPRQQDDIFRFFDEFFQGHPFLPAPPSEVTNLGTGFVINTEGYIVTNAHVVAKADEIKVKLDDDKHNKKREFDAKVIGIDELMDVALLKIPKHSALRAAPLGNSNLLYVGDWVFAIGNPLGHGHTLTVGVVSALGRDLSQINPYADFIQTDAGINPGNSGGPLINIHGEVVGINTAIDARGAGIGFAIPITSAKNILKQLKNKGKVSRGWIGIVIGPEIDEKWQKFFKVEHGIIVSDVISDEPAAKAGLQKNDVILFFNHKKVRSARDILKFVAEVPVGNKVSMTIYRDGKQKKLSVKVSERKSETTLAKRKESPEKSESDEIEQAIGISIIELDSDLRKKYRLEKELQGVLVSAVQWNSPAHKAGILEGDIIERVNRIKTENNEGFRKELSKHIEDKNILFNIIRQEQAIPVLVELE